MPGISSLPRLAIQKAGSLIGRRRRINFVEGSNVTLTLTDQPASGRVDVEIASSGGGGGGLGAEAIPVVESGRVYMPHQYIRSLKATGYVVADAVYCVPIWLPACDIDAVQIYCAVAKAGSTLAGGLYSQSGGLPGVPIVQGTASVATTGLKTITFATETLSGGLYFLAVQVDVTNSAFYMVTANNNLGLFGATNVSTDPHGTVEYSQAYTGTLPDLNGAAPDAYHDFCFQMGVRGA